jgi:hypothetical protein
MAGIAVLVSLSILNILMADTWGFDWEIYRQAAESIAAGRSPYFIVSEHSLATFRWSPVAAWLLLPLTSLGIGVWIALHGLALSLIGNWRLAALVGVSWPFWRDVIDGGIMIFVAVLALHAFRGNRWAGMAFLGMTLLVPRPLMLPLAVWLLWHRPEWRIGFALAFCAHALGVVATGWHVEWVRTLAGTAATEYHLSLNLSPSRWIGPAVLVIGVPLATWLTWKGRVGWAALAISPYILPPYLLMTMLEFDMDRAPRSLPPSRSADQPPGITAIVAPGPS